MAFGTRCGLPNEERTTAMERHRRIEARKGRKDFHFFSSVFSLDIPVSEINPQKIGRLIQLARRLVCGWEVFSHFRSIRSDAGKETDEGNSAPGNFGWILDWEVCCLEPSRCRWNVIGYEIQSSLPALDEWDPFITSRVHWFMLVVFIFKLSTLSYFVPGGENPDRVLIVPLFAVKCLFIVKYIEIHFGS